MSILKNITKGVFKIGFWSIVLFLLFYGGFMFLLGVLLW